MNSLAVAGEWSAGWSDRSRPEPRVAEPHRDYELADKKSSTRRGIGSGDEPPDAGDKDHHEHPTCNHRRRPDSDQRRAGNLADVPDAHVVTSCHSRLLRDRDGWSIVLVVSDGAAFIDTKREDSYRKSIIARQDRRGCLRCSSSYPAPKRDRPCTPVSRQLPRSPRAHRHAEVPIWSGAPGQVDPHPNRRRSGSTRTSRLDMRARMRLNPRPRSVSASPESLQCPLFETTISSLSSSRAPRTVTLPCACSIPFAAASWTASTTACRRSRKHQLHRAIRPARAEVPANARDPEAVKRERAPHDCCCTCGRT